MHVGIMPVGKAAIGIKHRPVPYLEMTLPTLLREPTEA